MAICTSNRETWIIVIISERGEQDRYKSHSRRSTLLKVYGRGGLDYLFFFNLECVSRNNSTLSSCRVDTTRTLVCELTIAPLHKIFVLIAWAPMQMKPVSISTDHQLISRVAF